MTGDCCAELRPTILGQVYRWRDYHWGLDRHQAIPTDWRGGRWSVVMACKALLLLDAQEGHTGAAWLMPSGLALYS